MGATIRSAIAGPVARLFAYAVCCLATAFVTTAHAQNYSDIWWNPSESGWGLTLVDHSTQLAGVWYTYTPAGRPIWYVMPAASFTQGKRLATLDIYQATGPAYNVPFNPSQVVQTKVGTATFDFAPPGLAPGVATFSYTLGSVSQTKQVQRTPFGDAAPVWGMDYTDILWDANESGWGLALAQHGSSIGGVWYTYGADGQPLWVLMPAVPFTTSTSFNGQLYTATGPSFSSVPFDSSQVHLSPAGDASINFTVTGMKIIDDTKQIASGNFIPRLNNFTQFKSITFMPFATVRPAYAGAGLPDVLFSDVFQAWLAGAGGWRARGIYAADSTSTSSISCGVDQFPDRATLEQVVSNAGGQISVSTPTEWCGQIGSELNCVKQFDNVVVIDSRDVGWTGIDIYMQGLVANRMTTISYSSDFGKTIVSSRTPDPSVTDGTRCSNSGQPTQAKEAINGDWGGYSVNYSPTSKVGSLTPSLMSCRNQTCTILGASNATFTLSSTTLWRTAAGAARLAGGSISTDLTLASMFLCNAATLDETKTFESCAFFSFKRL